MGIVWDVIVTLVSLEIEGRKIRTTIKDKREEYGLAERSGALRR